MTTFFFIHSPLTGPLTWQSTAGELRHLNLNYLCPDLQITHQRPEGSYWEHHVNLVRESMKILNADEDVILVGHSGAGVLLPAIGEAANRRISGYIFVDSDLPENGKSRFDLFDPPELADQFRALSTNEHLPVWKDSDLKDMITDKKTRQQFIDELKPLPIKVYEEKIPVSDQWRDAPCAYIQLSGNYPSSVRRAQNQEWTFLSVSANHFFMLNEPTKMAELLKKAFSNRGQANSA